QKCTITTFPFWSASLRGAVLIQSVTPVNSGAGAGLASTEDGKSGLRLLSRPQPATTLSTRLNPNGSTTTAARLAFIADLRMRFTLHLVPAHFLATHFLPA